MATSTYLASPTAPSQQQQPPHLLAGGMMGPPFLRRPELYKDCRLGKYDIIIWGRPNGEIKIGRIEKLSKVTKARNDDGSSIDQCGDPYFYYVYPKFHPDESVFKIRPIELKICDRYLRIGFVVKDFETGRVGYVQGLKQMMTVKVLNSGVIIRDIEFKDLIDPWKLNIQFKRPVYYNGWVGRITSPVHRRVLLRFVERKIRVFSFWIAWNELAHILVECGIIKMGTFSFESSGFTFWPGKKYKIPKRILLYSKYHIQWEGDVRPQGTDVDGPVVVQIVKTEIVPFMVQWTKRLPGFQTQKPKDRFTHEDTELLECIRPNLTSFLGDVRMYRIKSSDPENFLDEEQWKMVLRRRYCLPRVRTQDAPPPPPLESDILKGDDKVNKLEAADEVAVEVIYTRSTAEVAWTDGTISRVDSCKVCRVRNEFYEVGSFVEPVALPGINAFGVVQRVNVVDKTLYNSANESSAVVKWFYFGNKEDPEEQTYETELPVKLLKPHSQFSYKSKNCTNVLVCRGNSHQRFTVGFVVNTYPDGKVRVRCVDGTVRRFWPFEIRRISGEIKSSSKGDSNSDSTQNLMHKDLTTESSYSTTTSEDADAASVMDSRSLTNANWKKVIQQVSARNVSWKERQNLNKISLRNNKSVIIHATKSTS